ncbi:5-methylthioadenosine/S-adenosylhomocysteine deaminase [Gammaproteobacteria bacterium]
MGFEDVIISGLYLAILSSYDACGRLVRLSTTRDFMIHTPFYADILIHADWIAPVDDTTSLLFDHSLALREGRIAALIPTPAARRDWRAGEIVELPGHLLIPGLVNAHTHAAMTLLRGIADDLPLKEWLQQHIWPAEAHWVGQDFVTDGSRLAIAEMLRGGVTCFNDMYFFPDATAEAANDAGIRAVVGLIAIDFPTAWAVSPQEYLDKGLALRERLAHHPTLHAAWAPHAPYTVSDALLTEIRELAERCNLPIHIHVHETASEVAESMDRYGRRPLARLRDLGLLSNRLIAVHMTQLNPDEIDELASVGAQVVHCPESNLKLASGLCPVARLAETGVNVALGTDGAASNNDLDLLGEMRTAALMGKFAAQDASALSAASVLRMATRGGARALGLEGEIGSLEPGKAADVVAIDLSLLETQPVYNPISQLVYAASRRQVREVWIAGRRVLADGRLTTLNEAALVQNARVWRDRIADRMV